MGDIEVMHWKGEASLLLNISIVNLLADAYIANASKEAGSAIVIWRIKLNTPLKFTMVHHFNL